MIWQPSPPHHCPLGSVPSLQKCGVPGCPTHTHSSTRSSRVICAALSRVKYPVVPCASSEHKQNLLHGVLASPPWCYSCSPTVENHWSSSHDTGLGLQKLLLLVLPLAISNSFHLSFFLPILRMGCATTHLNCISNPTCSPMPQSGHCILGYSPHVLTRIHSAVSLVKSL